MSDDVFRSVVVSGDEAASLREMERLFRTLADASGVHRYNAFADCAHLIARRFERADEVAGLRVEILTARPAAPVSSLEAARRRRLTLVPGGSAA